MIVPLITRAVQPPVQSSSRDADTTGPNLHVVVAFCVIGILLTLYCLLRFPEFGALISQYNQF